MKATGDERKAHVAKEAAQAQDSNQALENFMHALSHDLRANLRAIDGFSHLLQNKYAEILPEEGRNFLKYVTDSAEEMRVRIEDLITYYQLRHRTLNKISISMDDLVRQTINELIDDKIKDKIEIILHPLPNCVADHELIKMILRVLISNSIKFSNSKNKSLIEVGVLKENNENIYYVKDNGVGFKMENAQKLFGVFQRFHSADEYKGTGIGLAKAAYIVGRHGGHIWAESSIEQGSVFYFTLGE